MKMIDIINLPGDPGAAEAFARYQFKRTMDEEAAQEQVKECVDLCNVLSSVNRIYYASTQKELRESIFMANYTSNVSTDEYEMTMEKIKLMFKNSHVIPSRLDAFPHIEEGYEVLVPHPEYEHLTREMVRGKVVRGPDIYNGYLSVMVHIYNLGDHRISRDKIVILD